MRERILGVAHLCLRLLEQRPGAAPPLDPDHRVERAVADRVPRKRLLEIEFESLGERLSLPPAFEALREQIEPKLTPIRNPREAWQKT